MNKDFEYYRKIFDDAYNLLKHDYKLVEYKNVLNNSDDYAVYDEDDKYFAHRGFGAAMSDPDVMRWACLTFGVDPSHSAEVTLTYRRDNHRGILDCLHIEGENSLQYLTPLLYSLQRCGLELSEDLAQFTRC